MDELSAHRAFVQVVERGSISAAARALGTSITAISRQVSGLEKQLGVRLLNRTTRRHSLTEAGQLYHTEIVAILNRLEAVRQEVSSYQDTVKGRLRISLRISVGNHVIVPALPRFLAQHPDVSLDVSLTDDRVDLVAQRIDVAVWLGELQDSSMIARRLAPGRRVICASPDYLNRHGRPATPDDLRRHNCLTYSAARYDNCWRLRKGGTITEVVVSGNLQASSSSVLLSGALAGLGLALLQDSTARLAVAKGELVRLLDDYQVSPTDADVALYAVYSGRHRVSPKTRAFIDFLVTLFQDD